MSDGADEVVVRSTTSADVARYAAAASALIEASSKDFEIAPRTVAFLTPKIEAGTAAIALRGEQVVGFGYFSVWEGGAFVSHSGLVVDPALRGHGLGRRLKTVLVEGTRRLYPEAATMSLTTSPQVRHLNESLGFVDCTFADLTTDEAFWDGCKACRNYEEVVVKYGQRCCCDPMILRPQGQ